jgi:HlyD family secretion protein
MRRTVTIILIIIILAGGGYWFYRQQQLSQEQAVEILRQATVERGTIAATVNATGSIEPEASASLSFGAPGTVQLVNVIRGQQVTAGDVLATLDAAELALALQQAEDALRIQQLTLEQAINSAASEATLAAAQADIDAAEGNLAVAEAQLAGAQAAVSQAIAQKNILLAGATAGQIAAAQQQVTAARFQQETAQEAYNQTLQCFTVTSPAGQEVEQCPGLGTTEERARDNLENANAALEAAEVQLADLQSGPRPADVQAADAAIAAAQAQVAGAEAGVIVAESNIARAEAAYARLLEGLTETEIAILEAQVTAAETSRDLAALRLEQAMVIAPMDGEVANILINQGEQAAPGAPAVILVNKEAFHIEVSVDEIDIDQIAIDQQVEITLDALPDQIVDGRIVDIAPTAVATGAGVVTYLVTINIEPGQSITLRPGMTANASIVVEEIEDVLVIPNWSIRLDRDTGTAFVNKLTAAGEITEVPVETDLRNEQFSEVLDGIEAGETVVVTNEREEFSLFGN